MVERQRSAPVRRSPLNLWLSLPLLLSAGCAASTGDAAAPSAEARVGDDSDNTSGATGTDGADDGSVGGDTDTPINPNSDLEPCKVNAASEECAACLASARRQCEAGECASQQESLTQCLEEGDCYASVGPCTRSHQSDDCLACEEQATESCERTDCKLPLDALVSCLSAQGCLLDNGEPDEACAEQKCPEGVEALDACQDGCTAYDMCYAAEPDAGCVNERCPSQLSAVEACIAGCGALSPCNGE